ncbi:MAG: zinc-dependent metalloprotease [Longimonas sp.]|uniref:zinc-dependent metalloprotease n=1 Tax=Longimonas sp. TaxID=2039626 RepID=UPI003974EB91
MTVVSRFAALVALLALLLTGCAPRPVTDEDTDSSSEPTSDIEEAVESAEEMDGLFTVYRDTTDGSLQMLIREDQLDSEYVYFTFTEDGAPVAGHFRGQFRDNEVFRLKRYYDRIEFEQVNTSFYFDPSNPLSRAADANISPARLASQEIVAQDTTDGGRYLISADELFLTEALHQVKPTPSPQQPPTAFSLGNLNGDKTRYADIRNYPENTDFIVNYVYDNPQPLSGGGNAVTDARSVGITVQHSLIEMPETDYTPRFDDPRVGYFMQQVDNQTSTSATPYRDLINRWHLEKADPEAELSEPVEPIVWWIENTTPEEIRPVIREATLAWNEAFEAAGFENAIEVKVQPDSADWDAGDIRYNVLRWTSSPTPPFGGYGPSFVNPHTGQIIGSDIMLEFVYLTNRLRQQDVFDAAALPDWAQQSLAEMQAHTPESASANHAGCALGTTMQQNLLTGLQVLQAQNASEIEVTEYVEQGLYYLILHEVGHTLGLNHNMQAHNLLSPDELQDPEVIAEQGLIGSVMDYPAVHLTDDTDEQETFFIDRPGAYDTWAIEFGYDPDLNDENQMQAHLNRSTEPELAFGNDADDMRSPGKGIDPRVMINTISSDPVEYAEGRFDILSETMTELLDKYDESGDSYEPLRNAYLVLTGEMGNMVNSASRFIGGVYRERAMIDQPGATQPFTPVPRAEQEAALELLRTHLFAPDAFDIPNEIYNHLQQQRRGFDFFGTTEDPKIHARALGMQRMVLAHILHPTVLTRMTDARLYGNEYPLAEYMDDLTMAIFEADADGDVNTFRQNLQVEYVQALSSVLDEEENDSYDYVARSAALRSLQQINDMIDGKTGINAETEAHTAHLQHLIDEVLES